MGANVATVTDLGNDVIEVRGTVDGYVGEDGNPILLVVFGWVSAMERHYDEWTPDESGNRPADAEFRPMTNEERMAYWQQLLLNAVPREVHPTESVLYQAPETTEPPTTPTEEATP